MQSQVKQVQSAGGGNGFWKWEITLDNGTTAYQFSKKDQCFVNPGDTIEYELGAFKDGSSKLDVKKKIAGPSVNSQALNANTNEKRLDFDKEKQIYIVRQSSLQRAIEFFNSFQSPNEVQPQNIKELAEEFTNYVMKGL